MYNLCSGICNDFPVYFGPQGGDGYHGEHGNYGPVGPDGPSNALGYEGYSGPTGANPIIGPTGPEGVTGPQGEQGIINDSGYDGYIGPTSYDAIGTELQHFVNVNNTPTWKFGMRATATFNAAVDDPLSIVDNVQYMTNYNTYNFVSSEPSFVFTSSTDPQIFYDFKLGGIMYYSVNAPKIPIFASASISIFIWSQGAPAPIFVEYGIAKVLTDGVTIIPITKQTQTPLVHLPPAEYTTFVTTGIFEISQFESVTAYIRFTEIDVSIDKLFLTNINIETFALA